MKTGPKPKPLIERIFAKCVTSSRGCVEFSGCTNGVGYGMVGLGPASSGKALVHRVVWQHFNGAIPDGLEVDHLCRNRRCCRLDHLDVVTARVNIRRAMGWTHTGGVWSCKRGHEMVGHNHFELNDGRVTCRECGNLSRRARRAEASGKEKVGA